MDTFYHIQISTKDNHQIHELDLTEKHVRDIVDPLKNNKRFLFSHQFLDPNDIGFICIIATSESYQDYWYNENEKVERTFEIMQLQGLDVTREFINNNKIQDHRNEDQVGGIRKGIQNAKKKIFVVHGHDKVSYLELSRLLEKWGLNPVILHEQPEGGRTIIEKFEDHASESGYAFILLTPDDIGGKDKESLNPRARQNVIFEMGFFIGKFGRERVCVLNKGVEFPSDIHGFAYVQFNKSIDECQMKIRQELTNAGYKLKSD